MQKMNRMVCIALVCIMVLLMTPFFAYASQVDSEAECVIGLRYSYTNEPLTDAEFYIYRIGNVEENGDYCLTGRFLQFPLDTSHLNIGASDL